MPRAPRSILDRFWEKVHIGEDHWLWIGGPYPSDLTVPGIINLGTGRGNICAPRFSLIIATGIDAPIGKFACHHCDIPKCVKPDDLFWGTPKENSEDMSRKGRAHEQKTTHCPKGHDHATHGYVTKGGGRRCHTCIIANRRKRYQEKGV